MCAETGMKKNPTNFLLHLVSVLTWNQLTLKITNLKQWESDSKQIENTCDMICILFFFCLISFIYSLCRHACSVLILSRNSHTVDLLYHFLSITLKCVLSFGKELQENRTNSREDLIRCESDFGLFFIRDLRISVILNWICATVYDFVFPSYFGYYMERPTAKRSQNAFESAKNAIV